jgi:hypothetical protein
MGWRRNDDWEFQCDLHLVSIARSRVLVERFEGLLGNVADVRAFKPDGPSRTSANEGVREAVNAGCSFEKCLHRHGRPARQGQ